MEITEHAIHMLAEVERSVQDHYCDFTDLAHGFEHVQRVYHLALIFRNRKGLMGLSWGWQRCCMMRDAQPAALRAHVQGTLCEACEASAGFL